MSRSPSPSRSGGGRVIAERARVERVRLELRALRSPDVAEEQDVVLLRPDEEVKVAVAVEVCQVRRAEAAHVKAIVEPE